MRPWTKGAVITAMLCSTFIAAGAAWAQADADTIKKIEEYRQALAGGNPAELWEARGEDLWKKKAGPKNVSLETCDLGLGAGKVAGAYAAMPRFFVDAGRVMDLEARLVHCRMTIQGLNEADAKRRPFGNGTDRSDNEALVAFITSESKGVKMNVAMSHPKGAEGALWSVYLLCLRAR